ncbi:MAG: hypothetical protein GX774_03925 [Armatimonadetes bacterium]|nr:hypothetical protein [Armatimonadota bacterium]
MRYFGVALACAGLLIQAVGAHAIQFAPPRAVAADEEVGLAGGRPLGLTVGLAASSWDMPTIDLGGGVSMEFEAQVRPLVTAEYQSDSKWSLGAWVNAIAWDVTLGGPGGSLKVADVDGTMFEIHGTYALPSFGGLGLSAQLGYQRTDFDITVPGSVTGGAALTDSVSQDKVVLWGLGTYAVKSGEEATKLTLLAGLGLQQNLDEPKFTEANALLGASYAFTPAISADASVWFNDFLRSENAIRFTAGVTGRF